MGGFTFALQSSSQRLMGLEPNGREVALYGALSPEELKRRELRSHSHNIELIDSDDNDEE